MVSKEILLSLLFEGVGVMKTSEELQKAADEAWLEASACYHGDHHWKTRRDASKWRDYSQKAGRLEKMAAEARRAGE